MEFGAGACIYGGERNVGLWCVWRGYTGVVSNLYHVLVHNNTKQIRLKYNN